MFCCDSDSEEEEEEEEGGSAEGGSGEGGSGEEDSGGGARNCSYFLAKSCLATSTFSRAWDTN